MKFAKKLGTGIAVLAVAALFAGCAKPPTQEMEGAKAAIDAAVAEGADKYAKEGLKALNDSWSAAEDEVKKQEGKLFKNYDNAKAMIAKVSSDAAVLKTEAVAAKEAARNAANEAAAAAKAAVDQAGALLDQAPMGKGSKADIEMMKADLAGLQGAIGEIDTLIASEEFLAASDRAQAVSAKAADISAQVQAAIDKAGRGRRK